MKVFYKFRLSRQTALYCPVLKCHYILIPKGIHKNIMANVVEEYIYTLCNSNRILGIKFQLLYIIHRNDSNYCAYPNENMVLTIVFRSLLLKIRFFEVFK